MCKLRPMVETKRFGTGLAEEREEVELIAVFELAVLADQGGVLFVPHDVARLLGVRICR